MTSGGGAVTSVASGSVVTLTATVNAGAAAVTPGQIDFCDASAAYCTDIHLLGTAQLTTAGMATMKFRPGIGSHSYKAVFLGTNNYAGSSSSEAPLAVTGTVGPFASATTITMNSGSWGSYTMSATVTETGGAEAPTGNVSFLDATTGNSVLGSAGLGPAAAAWSWNALTRPSIGSVNNPPPAFSVTDFNGDGIPDIAVPNYAANTVTILLGNGNGTFTVGPSTPAGTGPLWIASGDFNGDGNRTLSWQIGEGLLL